MRASHVFSVGSALPEVLAPLEEIVANLRWSWHVPSAELFRWIDPELWESTGRNPAALLDRVSAARLLELSRDPRFVEQLNKIDADLRRHKVSNAYYQLSYPKENYSIAYFSPEFGVTEALPQYSGGLGVLAGDHLKSASSLGIPITAVGIYYRDGYFSQSIRSDGWQMENYFHDPDMDRLVTSDPAHRFAIPIGNEILHVAVRLAMVGRIQLALLDTDLEENEVPLRNISDRLYGGDGTHRLFQEILLGIGGVRALEVIGVKPDLFHMNEGHAGFLTLERIAGFLDAGLSMPEAIEATRATTMFTTHTPVPAGIDRFPEALLEQYLGPYLRTRGIPIEEFLAFGSVNNLGSLEEFNMAHMGLRLSGKANAVSLEHEGVSRDLFSHLWPALDTTQIPIGHVTNGVHARSWISPEIDELLSKSLLDSWPEADAKEYDRLFSISLGDLAIAKRAGKVRLIEEIARRRRGGSRLAHLDAVPAQAGISPDTLIIGFARRFAPYKRATLLMRDPERLLRILKDADRPVAFLFAGKAHPADDPGKQLIQDLINFARENGVAERFIFLADYDIALARYLYQGCDVWLNTPRRPLEASGTSGMKAAMNGTLNCSILDGWWAECYDGQNGFAPRSAPDGLSPEEVDDFEGLSLFATLEDQLLPLYFRKDASGARTRWYEMVRYSMANLVPFISGARMVKQYTDELYVPMARRAGQLFADDFAELKKLSAWKSKVANEFPGVQIYSFEVLADEGSDLEVLDGALPSHESRGLHIEVSARGLSPDDLVVELLYGPVVAGTTEFSSYEKAKATYTGSYVTHGELEGEEADSPAKEVHLYRVNFDCKVGGTFGYLVQVFPYHELLADEFELGMRIQS